MAVAELLDQQVLIFKEGTTRAKGEEVQHANIMVAKLIAEAVKTSLGPKGMDKMLVESFEDITVTNDGAAILNEMDIFAVEKMKEGLPKPPERPE
ncbi:MAG: TCP-1/cpn60 chaperonin family protein [Candidatus Bathyarchaeia archaeon]